MVAEARTWIDVESAVREWARDNVQSVERRVFFGVNNTVWEQRKSQIVIFRIAGPDDRALIQFDCWAADKASAAEVQSELCTEADHISRYAHNGVLLLGADVESVRWQPDEAGDTPRYIVQATVTAVAES